MKNIASRIRTIALMVRIGWTQPGLFTVATFQSMSTLMELMLEVAKNGKPRMCKLATVVANEQNDIVTVWVGKGANADPYDRIVALRDECDQLRQDLNAELKKHP